MINKMKLNIIVCFTECYAILILILSLISFVFIYEGTTIYQVLTNIVGFSAFIQMFLSVGIIVSGIFAISLKQWALNMLTGLLFLTFVNGSLATLMVGQVRLIGILNPLLWIPIIIVVILTRPKVKERFK